MYKKLINASFLKFLFVGVVNTMVGTGIMFVLYNFFHCNYWLSSISNYILGSIVSFFLNKHFTFQNRDSVIKSAGKFIINIIVCYCLSYLPIKLIVKIIFFDLSISIKDNISMMIGVCIFTLLNYLGQRFFVFKNANTKYKNIN